MKTPAPKFYEIFLRTTSLENNSGQLLLHLYYPTNADLLTSVSKFRILCFTCVFSFFSFRNSCKSVKIRKLMIVK